jgi:hypothetical protein
VPLPEDDLIQYARIAWAASRNGRDSRLAGQARERAIADLAALAQGRSDLLARYAGVIVGLREGELDEPACLRAAQLCIEAGADTALIPGWITEGRRRAKTILGRTVMR